MQRGGEDGGYELGMADIYIWGEGGFCGREAGEQIVNCDIQGGCEGDQDGNRGFSSVLLVHGYGAYAESQGLCEFRLAQAAHAPQLCDSFSHMICLSFLPFFTNYHSESVKNVEVTDRAGNILKISCIKVYGHLCMTQRWPLFCFVDLRMLSDTQER